MTVPNIWENKSHVLNHQPDIFPMEFDHDIHDVPQGSHLMCFRKCSWICFIFSSSSVNRKPSLLTDRDKITTPGIGTGKLPPWKMVDLVGKNQQNVGKMKQKWWNMCKFHGRYPATRIKNQIHSVF